MADRTRQAEWVELEPAVDDLVAAGRFRDRRAVRAFWEDDPWRVRVLEAGEIALVDRWRDHEPHLAVEAIRCGERRLGPFLTSLAELARERGLERLLSPPLDPEAALPYRRAGMRVARELSVFRRAKDAKRPGAVWAVEPGSARDLQELLDIEQEAFDSFWRYDRRHLEHLYREERLTVVREGVSVLGYAFSSTSGKTGTIGRLAVRRSAQRRGIAGSLLAEALDWFEDRDVAGVGVTTQTENRAARALYRSSGFRESSVRLLLLVSDKL